jgi:hypothetical protein
MGSVLLYRPNKSDESMLVSENTDGEEGFLGEGYNIDTADIFHPNHPLV